MQTLGPIKRQKTLTEQAADAIRLRIVEGQFDFGEALSEIALANELGVSKTPVREAFLQLKNEGLVEILPQRGTFVFRMSTDQMRQLWEMREILEVNSLRFAMRNDNDALIRRLAPILENLEDAAKNRDAVTYRRFDADFHTAIIEASSNYFIQSGYNIIALRVQAFRNRASFDVQNWRSVEEHADVGKFVRSNEPERAAEALCEHIRGAFTAYLERIKGKTANVA